MSKRPLDDGEAAYQKRQKLSQPVIEGIESARQLTQLLKFQQGATPELRAGIKAFKVFLESIAYAEDKTSTTSQQSILKEFLDLQKPEQEDQPHVASLIQSWSFAAQINNDGLQSQVSAVLALLLKTISTLVDFRDHGILIGQTLLQQSQLALLSKGLSAEKHKEHVISPCLRLLTELVSFDGGALANQIFRNRHSTLDPGSLARNLSLWKPPADTTEETNRKPSVRSNAVRYFLANLKLQPSQAKSEILKDGFVLRSLLGNITHDPIDLSKQIFDTLTVHVLSDGSIPRKLKGYLFGDRTLSSIASLYRQGQHTSTQLSDLVNAFLIHVCTSLSAGVLKYSNGWYPSTLNLTTHEGMMTSNLKLDLGLDSIEWYNDLAMNRSTRNNTLATFAQNLRPYSQIRECQLLLSIFEAAPDLVADYFSKKSTFNFEPKLTATWIGYSAFLGSVVRLPIPDYFGAKTGYAPVPPATTTIIESILPSPLTQKVLTRCLNQQCELITFIALRLMVSSFQKLALILHRFREAESINESLWRDGADRLLTAFSARCVAFKDVISTFKRMPEDNRLQREATLRLISLYYSTTPLLTYNDSFDSSILLNTALSRSQNAESTSDHEFDVIELSHIIDISDRSQETKWWHKPESLQFSPFTFVLKILAADPGASPRLHRLLASIVFEHSILQQETTVSSFDALIASLSADDDWKPTNELFNWLDDAFGRLVRKPIKYEDDLERTFTKIESTSLLWMTLLEQWSFAKARKGAESIAQWLNRFRSCCLAAGENSENLNTIETELLKSTDDNETLKQLLCSSHLDVMTRKLASTSTRLNESLSTNTRSTLQTTTVQQLPDFASLFAPPSISDSDDNTVRTLHRCSSKSPPDAIHDGNLSSLVLLLSSPYLEVRTSALAQIRTFTKRIDPSTSTPAHSQIWLLLSILLETLSTPGSLATPSTNVLTVYIFLCIPILSSPSHPLYPKLNALHLRSPRLSIPHLPSTLVALILDSSPGASSNSDSSAASYTLIPDASTSTSPNSLVLIPGDTATYRDPHHAELHFLLTYLYNAARSAPDLDILRQRRVLERVSSLLVVPESMMPSQLRGGILALLWRIAGIEGGSDVLLTRRGGVAFLGGLIREDGETGGGVMQLVQSGDGVKALVRKLWEACDREHIGAWSGGFMGRFVEGIVGEE